MTSSMEYGLSLNCTKKPKLQSILLSLTNNNCQIASNRILKCWNILDRVLERYTDNSMIKVYSEYSLIIITKNQISNKIRWKINMEIRPFVKEVIKNRNIVFKMQFRQRYKG